MSTNQSTVDDYYQKKDNDNATAQAVVAEEITESSSSKRELSLDSPTGLSPEQKKTALNLDENSCVPEEAFDLNDDSAPAWAQTMMKMMKKSHDVLSRKIDGLRSDYETQIKTVNIKMIEIEQSVAFQADQYDSILQRLSAVENENSNLRNLYESQAKTITAVEERNNELVSLCKKQDQKNDQLEQYGRRNCLLLHGVPEKKNEDTDEVFIDTVNEHLGLKIGFRDIGRSHRLGAPREDGSARPIIAKFPRYNVRASVYGKKKMLKGTSLLITESLTQNRVRLLKKAISDFEGRNVWTVDGDIYINDNGQKKRYDPEVHYIHRYEPLVS